MFLSCLKEKRNVLTLLQTPRAADLTASFQAADFWLVQIEGKIRITAQGMMRPGEEQK